MVNTKKKVEDESVKPGGKVGVLPSSVPSLGGAVLVQYGELSCRSIAF